jgi:hypothetical protein
MSLSLFSLPDILIFTVIAEWMEINGAGLLDSAICNHERRGKLLEIYIYSSFHQSFCNLPLNSLKVFWIADRHIKLTSISFLVEYDEQLISYPAIISKLSTELVLEIAVCSKTSEIVPTDFFAFLFACCPAINELFVGGFDNNLVDILNSLSENQASQLLHLTVMDWGFESTSAPFLEKLILDCHSLQSLICDSMIDIRIEHVVQLIIANENLEKIQFVAEEDEEQSLSLVQYINEVNKDDEIVSRSIKFVWDMTQSNEEVSQMETFFSMFGGFTAASIKIKIRNTVGKYCFDWMHKLYDKSPKLRFLNIDNEHQSASITDLCASLSLFRYLTNFRFVIFSEWSSCDIVKLIDSLPASITSLNWTHKSALTNDVIKRIFNSNLNQLRKIKIGCSNNLDIKSVRKSVAERSVSLKYSVKNVLNDKQEIVSKLHSFVVK